MKMLSLLLITFILCPEVVFVKYDWCNQRRRFLFSYKLCKKYVWLRQWNRRRKRKNDIRNVVIATIYIGPVSENVTITYRIHVLWDIKIISGRWSTYRHRITRIAQFSIAQLIVWLHTKTYAFGNYKIKAKSSFVNLLSYGHLKKNARNTIGKLKKMNITTKKRN